MKRFIARILIFSAPLILIGIALIILYIYVDPGMVIWDYEDYSDCKSRVFRSAVLLEKSDTDSYNSFIVGSSRTEYYPCSEWEKYLDGNSQGKSFHLSNNSDGVYEVRERLNYIYRYSSKIKEVRNVLLMLDYTFLRKTYPGAAIHNRCPYQMSPNISYIRYQYEFMKFAFTVDGLQYLLGLGEYKSLFPFYYDNKNERHSIGQEALIEYNSEYYYTHWCWANLADKERTLELVGTPVITEQCKEILSDIHNLFMDGHTNYKIIVHPMYDQIKLNPVDKSVLDSIFGVENVYDFSGENKYTENIQNYYDPFHYRPNVAAEILKEVYKQ